MTPSNFSGESLGVKLWFTNHIFFFRTAAVRKLFDIRFSYNHCNFSRVCLLVKMASKTVTRSIKDKDERGGVALSPHAGVQTDATTPNIVGPTMLGVVTSVLALMCKRM